MEPRTHINFGSGTKLIAERYFIEASGNQFNTYSFRRFLQVLRVPSITIGNTRYIDAAVFEFALAAILRVGQRNFYCSGSDDARRKGISTCDPDDLEENWRIVMKHLLYKKKLHGVNVTRKVRDTLRGAVKRLRQSGMATAPSDAQRRLEGRWLREHDDAVS